jgi:hypothetical protein
MTSITFPATPVLSLPANGAGYVATSGNLVWFTTAGAAEYDVYLDNVTPPAALLSQHVTDTTAAYAGLASGRTYYWRVVARNVGGTAQSAIWSFSTGAGLPTGWIPKKDTLTGVAVKDGGALVYNGDLKRMYALKGNKTFEFWKYTPVDSTWSLLAPVPPGPKLKQVSKGAALAYGGGFAYVMKGNSTNEFYRFNTTTEAWAAALRNVPLETTQTLLKGKPVKGGGGLAYVNKQDTAEYVYLLKGTGTDFYKYDIRRDTFYSMASAPYSTKAKYDKGSWIVYDGSRYIYAMQAKYNALFRYDVIADRWETSRSLTPMPLIGRMGKSKKVGDGSCSAWEGTAIYALKGNSTLEFWKYRPGTSGDTWTELETIPQAPAGGKKKKVKSGAGIAFYPEVGIFYALKGNKSNQFWVYSPGAAAEYAVRPNRDGVVAAGRLSIDDCRLTIAPNPMVDGYANVRYSLPAAGTADLSIHDVTGRVVLTRTFNAGRTGAVGLDLRNLATGVYLVKLSSADFVVTSKLTVQH